VTSAAVPTATIFVLLAILVTYRVVSRPRETTTTTGEKRRESTIVSNSVSGGESYNNVTKVGATLRQPSKLVEAEEYSVLEQERMSEGEYV